MATTPPTINAAPTPPQRGDKTTFSGRVDLFVTWLVAAVSQFAAVATNVYNNAIDAFNSATAAGQSATNAATSEANALASANAAAVTTGATLWVSGQTVAQDAAKISPADRRTYRKKTASSSTTVDPSIDPTNYVLLSADASSLMLLGSATISSAVANIDFLNVFSDAYVKYIIEVNGMSFSNSVGFSLRLAVGGVVDTSSTLAPGNPNSVASFSIMLHGMRTTTAGKGAQIFNLFPTTAPTSYSVGDTSAASGFRLFLSGGGTFTGGTVRVYGVRA